MAGKEQNQILRGGFRQGTTVGPLSELIATATGEDLRLRPSATDWFSPYGVSLALAEPQADVRAPTSKTSGAAYEERSIGVGAPSSEALEKARRERAQELMRELWHKAVGDAADETSKLARVPKGVHPTIRPFYKDIRGKLIGNAVEDVADAIPPRRPPPPDPHRWPDIGIDMFSDPYISLWTARPGVKPTREDFEAFEALDPEERRQRGVEARKAYAREQKDRAYWAAQRRGEDPLLDPEYPSWNDLSEAAFQALEEEDRRRRREAEDAAAHERQNEAAWRSEWQRQAPARPSPPITPGPGRVGSTMPARTGSPGVGGSGGRGGSARGR